MASHKQEILGKYLDYLRGEETAYFSSLTRSELAHLSDLRVQFTTVYNSSYSTGKAFKNPLNNLDIAWLYKMVEKEEKSFWNDKYARPFLKYIDICLANLRKKKIPIVGE